MSRGKGRAVDMIGNETAIDDLRQLALEAAQSLPRRLVLGKLALVVVPTEPGVHRLDASGQVQGVVERPVSVPREAVPGDFAARDLDGGRARVAGEGIVRPEAVDVADVAQDLRREDVADAEDRRQCRPARGDGIRTASPVLGEHPVDPPQVGDQRPSHELALEVDRGLGTDPAEQPRRGRGGELRRRAAGAQIAEQPVEPVDDAAALPGELVAAVRQEPQHGRVVLGADAAQPGLTHGNPSDAPRVEGVGLAPVATIEEAGPGGQRRRHVQHGLVGGDEPLGEEVSQPRRPFDGPGPIWPAAGPAQASLGGRARRGHPEFSEAVPIAVERNGGVGRLVWVDADRDHLEPPRAARTVEHRGGQPEFQGAPHASIEPRRRRSVAGRHAMREPHPNGGQGAWEPTGHRPRTLWPAGPGCWAHLNKSGAWYRPHSAVSASRSSVVTSYEEETGTWSFWEQICTSGATPSWPWTGRAASLTSRPSQRRRRATSNSGAGPSSGPSDAGRSRTAVSYPDGSRPTSSARARRSCGSRRSSWPVLDGRSASPARATRSMPLRSLGRRSASRTCRSPGSTVPSVPSGCSSTIARISSPSARGTSTASAGCSSSSTLPSRPPARSTGLP